VYKVYKVPLDAEDDPPICGVELVRLNNYAQACELADAIMEQEQDSSYAYFVIDSNWFCPYNVGYLEPVEMTT
jgi:hypothetical protein